MTTLETQEWRMQSDTWVCPGCLRHKQECEVPKGDGQTLRWLVWHHDHMRDYVKAHVKAKHGGHRGFRAEAADRREAHHFINRVESLAVRFNDVVVCLDCNEVEGKIKAKIRADKYFSFHPHELRRAFVPSANERHAFVPEHMEFYRRFYEAHAGRLVLERKRIIERLIDDAGNAGHYWGTYTQPDATFSQHELQVVYPEFDSGQRIAESLQAGQAPMQGASWNSDHDELLRTRVRAGASIDEIARELGRTAAGVRFRLDHLGVTGRPM